MRKQLVSAFIALVAITGYTQELPDIIPPSPVAHQLGQYGDIEVGNFTGTIQPNIPLLTYQTNNLSIPVSLSYYSNGIKVDQLSGNVGLGWSLNIGGVISRVVHGKPDEERTQQINVNIIGNSTSDEAVTFYEGFSIANDEFDTTSDVFNFNFLGKSGKFVLGYDLQPVLLNSSGIQIERNNNNTYKIIDEFGVQYYFSDTESSQSRRYGDGFDYPKAPAITAWYLTKITHPNGDEIYFNYDSESYTYDLGKSQSMRELFPIHQDGCSGQIQSPFDSTISRVATTKSTISDAKRVTSVTNNINATILNITYKNNPEILGIVINNLVDRITLKNSSNVIIENVKLNHLITNSKRIFLTNIGFLNPDKQYHFEYENPQLLPERLSFSQDHWGYYNGKNNHYFFPNPSKMSLIPAAFKNWNIGADKEIDVVKSKYGLLNKIQYPTKGSTEFEYEGNSFSTTVEEYVSPNSNLFLESDTSLSIPFNSDSKTFSVKKDQEVSIIENVQFNSLTNECSNPIPNHIKATLVVENLTKTQDDIFFERTTNGNYSRGKSYTFSPTNNVDMVLNLLANCSYRITLSTNRSCLSASTYFSYNSSEAVEVEKNIPLGGLRIKSTKNRTESGQTQLKRYYYGRKESPNLSSGERGNTPWYLSEYNHRTYCNVGSSLMPELCLVSKDNTYIILGSSSTRNLYTSSSSASTNYKYVTVSYGGDNFENGGEEFEYHTDIDDYGRVAIGKLIQGSQKNNFGWKNGLLKRKNVFKILRDKFITLNTVENEYIRDERINEYIYGFTIKKNYNIRCSYKRPDRRNLENLDVVENSFRTNWSYLNKTRQISYDTNGQNPLTTTTNYYYDNDKHLQPTKTITTNSKGETLITETKYAHDVNNTNLLSKHRIAEPLEVLSSKKVGANTTPLSHQKTVYKDFNGIYLPEIIQTLKGKVSPTNSLENRIIYHDYDTKGNPIEVSKADGTKIYYVWGYQGTQPIAKIEGYTTMNSTQLSAINSAITASDADKSTTTENTFRTRLTALRNAFASTTSQVTTFTYDPLIGVTSITDPRGEVVYYEYDEFNRLKFVRNSEGQIVKENVYHYKNQ